MEPLLGACGTAAAPSEPPHKCKQRCRIVWRLFRSTEPNVSFAAHAQQPSSHLQALLLALWPSPTRFYTACTACSFTPPQAP